MPPVKAIKKREGLTMQQVPRISPEEAREKVISGTALLVCAYADEEIVNPKNSYFQTNKLEGLRRIRSFPGVLK